MRLSSIPPAPPLPALKNYLIQVVKGDTTMNFILKCHFGISQHLQERASLVLLLAPNYEKCEVIKTRHGLHLVTNEGQIWLHLGEKCKVEA